MYQSINKKNQEKLEHKHDTEKSHPQNQSDSQNLEPGLFQPQNCFEKSLSTSNSSPEVNSISPNDQSNIQSFPASTMTKEEKSKIEEPLMQPTSTKHSKEKSKSNFMLVDNNPSTSKVIQTSNEEPSPSHKKKKLPQSGLFNPFHSDHFEEKISHYQPLSVSS
ncbi:hypothetical protein O181_131069 [Austropuccinia psidii MF-1]|uniref:Uncharacterized protein n=1 Tax=Austropuccinia psidii MF-1 TaxID=1389203 RepID=A0A9Q3L512_9BASI|nr:hypothetical protein [Austropuccinia psidii MF-1]